MSRRHDRFLTAGALLAFVLAARVAHAEPAPRAPSSEVRGEANAEMKLHFQRGVKFYSEEDYRAALVEFKRAYELSSNSAILYNIGQTQFQIHAYADALQSLEKYLSAAEGTMTAARRQQVEKDLEDLRGRVAKVTIDVTVPGASITLDDVPLGAAPLAGPLDVSAGLRKFGATRDGYVAVTRSVELAGGDATTVRLELVPIPVEPPRPVLRETPPARQTHAQRGTHPLVFVGYGVAAAGVTVGAVAGVLALSTKSDLDARCPDRLCGQSDRGNVDSLALQATISTIGFGVGLLGAGLGTYFLVSGRGAAPTTGRARVSPWFAGTSAGLGGTF